MRKHRHKVLDNKLKVFWGLPSLFLRFWRSSEGPLERKGLRTAESKKSKSEISTKFRIKTNKNFFSELNF
jgi:hypothetical protein